MGLYLMGHYLSMGHNLSIRHYSRNTVNLYLTYGTSKLTSICIRVNFLAYSLDNYRHISRIEQIKHPSKH